MMNIRNGELHDEGVLSGLLQDVPQLHPGALLALGSVIALQCCQAGLDLIQP